jgi:single-strand DNA-binding protein
MEEGAMAALNKVYLLGNLTRDPELRHTSSGNAVCTFGMAMNHRYMTAKGESKEEVCYVEVEAWGRWAEACDSFLRKGAPVLVEGRLRYEQWDDKETGQKRSRLRVVVEHGQFVGGPARKGAAPEEAAREPLSSPGPVSRPQPPVSQTAEEQAIPEMPPFEPTEAVDDDIPF